jgi:uncharacterized membrane protein YdbT with pleckstrin-like domain
MMFGKELSENEKILVVVRKHWLIFAVEAFLLILAALAPLVVAALVPAGTAQALMNIGVSINFLLLVYVLYVLQLWTFIFIAWTTYFLDVWVVTNHRIINIDQRTLFFRDMTTLMIEKIQDVTVEVRGVFATIFGFGKLTLRTAGENEDISLRFAAHPQYAKDMIIEAQEGARLSGNTDAVAHM